MRALCVFHDAVSSAGLIGDALSDRHWQVDEFLVVPADRHDSPNIEVSFPDSSDYDLLVVLGAPWAAYDDAGIGRWLTPELRWLSGTVAAGGAVLGICFGAQVLARALGGSVARSAEPEIGWVRIDSRSSPCPPLAPKPDEHRRGQPDSRCSAESGPRQGQRAQAATGTDRP